jgi:hypothetical protein
MFRMILYSETVYALVKTTAIEQLFRYISSFSSSGHFRQRGQRGGGLGYWSHAPIHMPAPY